MSLLRMSPYLPLALMGMFASPLYCKSEHTNIYRGIVVDSPLAADNFTPPTDKCRIFLIRHGETEWNVLGLPQGWEDVPLNEIGKEQAAHVALNFSNLSISAIYTSVLSRAVETATTIASYHPETVVYFEPALRFYDPNKKKNITEASKKEIKAEIKAEIIELATAYLKELSNYHIGQNVIILTHGKVIKHLVEDQNIPHYTKIKIDNAAMVCMLGNKDSLVME